MRQALVVPAARSTAGLPGRLREPAGIEVPPQADRRLLAAGRLLARPVGAAMVLSPTALIRAYAFTGPHRRASW
ncbi:hypothetical protein [Streptomyces peucetius]|nr:hypothetical protein CGZ69_27320 [Streptomyces peucetius subsp. caesius ATCC 27952]